MNDSAEDRETPKQGVDSTSLRVLKHDINNQLSNIILALEQLRYEIPNPSEDILFYIDSISESSAKIIAAIKEMNNI